MTKLRKISFVFLISLFLQCSLVVPDVTGYIAALVGLIPKSKQSTTLEYEIRVSVSGLVGTGLVLQNNGSDNLTIPANGGYAFLQKIASNSTYAVTILTQPTNPSQTCVVTGGSGTVISGDVTSIVVNCSTTTYTLGGTVTGLLGTGLILQNAGGETQIITSNGNFAFATPFADGRSYSISIQTQPSNPAQVCTVTNGTGVIASANVSSISVSCNTNTYTVGGTVNGLLGTGLVLQNNNGDNLTLSANGSFTFATAINSGASYSVSILSQPVNPVQSCIVTGGTGTIVGGNVTSVSINCSTNTFTLGGTVTGLFGAGMILQNNGGDNLTISANGSFAFSTPINSGAAYNVTISTQPGGVPSQTCMITNNAGTVSNANITNITVNCIINSYVVGGTVSGFSGSGLILQNNSTNNLVISGNGAFVFSVPINSGAGYSVSVFAQPTSPVQTCVVTGGTGSIVSGNITSVSVNCTTNTYTIGGTVTGLSGTGLVLQNNAGNNLTISANGSFAFSTPINSGAGYSVSILAQPTSPSQTCIVTGGTGSIVSGNITSVSVNCTTNSYTVGGTVTGLTGTGLVLQNNNGDNLSVSASGTFTFATAINSGLGYSITVLTQPSSPIQTCIVTGGTGTIVGGNITSVSVNCTTNTYTIGGTVTGLSGTGLVLQNNAGNNLTISANGSFAFSTPINSGVAYSVTVLTQPISPTQTCSISSGTGTVISSNIADVSVSCTTNTYTIGGIVSGLSGNGLVLQNNSGNNLTITANGSFTFTTAINSGATYSVTVSTQPTEPNQTCSVMSGAGTVISANITTVSVSCINTYTIGGTISGLSGTSIVLRNNGADDLTVSADGSFTFATSLNSGVAYTVTIFTQPTGRVCSIANNTGNATAMVINITVTCTSINTLYALNMQTQQIRAFTVYPDGTLILLDTYSTGMASAVILLWNGKHIITGGVNTLKSYLKNADGSLTVASTFTTATGVFSGGTTSIHPNGKFFYVSSGNDQMSKFQIDTSGVFSGEVQYTQIFWLSPGPVHPTGNYLFSYHTAGQAQHFWPIADTNTGALGTQTGNATQITTPPFNPEQANCTYSPNGNFLYCADAGSVSGAKSGGNIKQMSITSTSLTPLDPFNVDPEAPSDYKGPKSVIVHPNGNFLFVYGNINVFSYNLSSSTGLIGSQITSLPAPGGSCGLSHNQITKLQLNSTGTYLFSICNNTGDIGVYPVSGTGVLSTPTITSTTGSTGGQTLLYVNGI